VCIQAGFIARIDTWMRHVCVRMCVFLCVCVCVCACVCVCVCRQVRDGEGSVYE